MVRPVSEYHGQFLKPYEQYLHKMPNVYLLKTTLDKRKTRKSKQKKYIINDNNVFL